MLMQTKSTHSITNVRQSQFVFGARALSTASWAACHAMTFFQSSIRTSPACRVLSRWPTNNGPNSRQCQSCVAGAVVEDGKAAWLKAWQGCRQRGESLYWQDVQRRHAIA